MVSTLQMLVHKVTLSEAVGMLPLREKHPLGSDQQLQIAYLIHRGSKPCIKREQKNDHQLRTVLRLMRMFVLLKASNELVCSSNMSDENSYRM